MSLLRIVNRQHRPLLDRPRSVEQEYRALHDVETRAPEGITFYSGVWGRSYAVDRRSAAEAIAAQASGMIDFPALIERAYEDGVRVFLEVGPGSSCTRLIGQILGRRPHLAVFGLPGGGRSASASFWTSLGRLIAERSSGRPGRPLRRDAGPEPLASETSPPSSAESLHRFVSRCAARSSTCLPCHLGRCGAAGRCEARSPARSRTSGANTGLAVHSRCRAVPPPRRTARFCEFRTIPLRLIARHVAYELELIDEWERAMRLPGASETIAQSIELRTAGRTRPACVSGIRGRQHRRGAGNRLRSRRCVSHARPPAR